MASEMSEMEISKLLNNFKEYLLNSSVKDSIAKIILFGSYAKGVATRNSDVDVLILLSNGVSTEKSLMDKVYDFMVERNIPIEVVTSSITEVYLSHDYFLYNVTHHGLEVYSMEKEDIKIAAMKDIRNLAEEYLDSAEEVLARNRTRLAVDAAYNAVELAAKGLILLKRDDLPGSHGGVVSLFGQLYIKTEEVEKEIGRGLNVALKLRNEARYKPSALLTKENAQDIINLAKGLIKLINEKLGEE